MFCILVYFQKNNSKKVTDHRYVDKIGQSVFEYGNRFGSIFWEEPS